MGVKWLLAAMVAVLFRPEAFWSDARERLREVNAMKEYAAPLIAIAQFCKLPLFAVPRMAMLMAIIGFTVDVAALWLLSGAIAAVAGAKRAETLQQEVMMVLCYSLTPLWFVEPFGIAGTWRWIVMAAALAYALFIARLGMLTMLGDEIPEIEPFFGKSALLIATAAIISFLLQGGLLRFFTSF
ncbi:MAG: hypothetical protein HGB06_10745 [Chlorobaculum sp.]|jgi:hypothetical protein|nr:hypothetical protein [Chlorobaculum sp.]